MLTHEMRTATKAKPMIFKFRPECERFLRRESRKRKVPMTFILEELLIKERLYKPAAK